jgi:putative FmdB family regulatory protein
MPIYEYSCNACDTAFELLIRGKETPACPECESEDLERQISLSGVKSDTTRGLAMRAAKKRDAGQAKDNMHERMRYEESHDRHG